MWEKKKTDNSAVRVRYYTRVRALTRMSGAGYAPRLLRTWRLEVVSQKVVCFLVFCFCFVLFFQITTEFGGIQPAGRGG